MNEEERQKIISNDFADGIIEYALSSEEYARYAGETINYINDNMLRFMFLFPKYPTD